MIVRRYPNHPAPWLMTIITESEGTKFVDIESAIHKTKFYRMPHSYSAKDFTDGAIMSDSDYLRCAKPFM